MRRRCCCDGCEVTPTVELLDAAADTFACDAHVEQLAKGRTVRFRPLALSKRGDEDWTFLDAPQPNA